MKRYYIDGGVGQYEYEYLEFRCYFCDELKNEEPYYFSLSGLKKEPVCSRCHGKMEVVRRLKKSETESGVESGSKD